jgi:hypothetical protein
MGGKSIGSAIRASTPMHYLPTMYSRALVRPVPGRRGLAMPFQARDFATDYRDQLTVFCSLFSVLGLDQHSCDLRHDGVDPSFLLARTTEAAPSLRFRASAGQPHRNGPRAILVET